MSWQDVKHDSRKCKWCGKEFTPTSYKNVFCSRTCMKKQHSEYCKKTKSAKKPKSNQELIVDVAKEAKAHGMSYGRYVALMYTRG